MRLRLAVLFSVTVVLLSTMQAQRLVGLDTLYGNEWIESSEYLKVKVTESGVYKVSQAELNALGWSGVAGEEIKLSFLGQEHELFVSNDGFWTASDFLFFYADGSDFSAYEQEIYLGGSNVNFNPNQKLFSDTVAYYLSREQGPHLRYDVKDPVTSAPIAFDTSLLVTQLPIQNAGSFHSRRINSVGAQSSQYEIGDGWMYGLSSAVNLTFSHFGLDVNHDLTFKTRTVSSTYGASGVQRERAFLVNGVQLYAENSATNQFYEDEMVIQPSQLSAGTSTVFRINGTANSNDRYAVGESTLEYHRITSSLSGAFVWQSEDLVNPVRWGNVPATGLSYAIDIERGILQEVNAGMPFSDIALNQSSQRGVFLAIDDAKQAVLEPLVIEDLDAALSADYLIITSRKLQSWTTNASDYANFRSSAQHGGYDVAILEVEDLIDQFGYGVPNDPRYVRNAISYFADKGNAERVLLLGKGRTFNGVRFESQLTNPINSTFYIPSFGIPASDNLLAFNPLTKKMSLSIGRLSVQNAEQIDIVLEKYRATADVDVMPQSISDRFWTKQTVIIGGGKEPQEQSLLKNYLFGFTDILANGELGIEATGLYKTTTEPVQLTASEAYYDRVSQGVSLVSFFGHAAATTLDVAIDDFTQYSNEGKYPFFVGLGCYAGDANSPNESLSETFVFEPRKSMSGFLASVGLSYPGATANFTRQFYENLSGEHFGLPISDALTDVLSVALNSLSFQTRNFAEQLVYHGDPAARLFIAEGTDLIINEDEIKIGPSPLTSSIDSITVSIEVLNLGKSDTSAFEIEWSRRAIVSDRSEVDTVLVRGGVYARKQVDFKIPSLFLEGRGLNEISFRIIPRVQQQPLPAAERNDGTAPMSFFVASSVVNILWPEDKAIVAPEDLRIVANFGNAWDGTSNYDLEIARDANFLQLVEQERLQEKSLLKHEMQGNYVAGDVIYARVKLSVDTIWESISFRVGEDAATYGRGVKGYDQASQGTIDRLKPLTNGEWQFGPEGIIKVLTNKQYDPVDPPTFEQNLQTPYISVLPWQFLDAGISILVADSLTGDEFRNSPPQYGSVDCGSPNRAFAYPTNTPAERQLVVDFLNTVPKPGEFVYVFTIYRDTTSLNPADWALDTTRGYSESIISVLRDRGAQKLSDWAARGTVPYTYMYRQGGEKLREDVGTSREDVIVSTISVPLRARQGEYRTPRYSEIDSVYAFTWSIDSSQVDTSNRISVRLIGYTESEVEVVLANSEQYSGRISFTEPLSDTLVGFEISVIQSDAIYRRPMPVVSLELFGKERPEIVFDPSLFQTFEDSVLKPGQSLDWGIGIANVSPTPVDSITARLYELESNISYGTVQTLSSLDPWQSVQWSQQASLGREAGDRELAFSITPFSSKDDKDDINNLAFARVEVQSDLVDPLINLFVDGDNIRNRMLISPEPTIQIQLKDDYGIDISGVPEDYIQVELTSPTGDLYTSNVNLLGSISVLDTSDVNRLRFEYLPGRLRHGVWKLKVLASDSYGNQSGDKSLAYELEVDTTSSVSSFLPYPNPAVDRVYFHYELTGEVPLDYQVDIYTTSGRLIRSLGPTDLGQLQIGRQRTDEYWDGTDTFGNPLARGVYLYRVSFAQTGSGAAFENRSTAMDTYVKSGFGKLVLLR